MLPTALTYTETPTYDAAGHVTALAFPAVGGLPAETLTATWTPPRPHSLTTTAGGTLVAGTGFDVLARLTDRHWASSSGPSRSYGYDWLNRVITSVTTIAGNRRQDDAYTYTGPQPSAATVSTVTVSGRCTGIRCRCGS